MSCDGHSPGPNINTNETQTAQTCYDQYSTQTDYSICGLKNFEKVAPQMEKYPVQIKMGELHRGILRRVETRGTQSLLIILTIFLVSSCS